MKPHKVELLAPAGDWGSLSTAIDAGADAVYFGVKGINMRMKANNFDLFELPKIMDKLHGENRKGYLTLNTTILNSQLDKVKNILKKAKEAEVDAIIFWDMAVLQMAKDLGLKLHLSTQGSVSNHAALKFYSDLGVSRIVLARENTLEDIRAINQYISDWNIPCQTETFVHGAMCVSISGRCFMSAYTFGKSANQGECKQPCRREFIIKDTKGESEYVLGKDYVLSPKDLCTIQFIDKIIDAGVSAFKIEGRMRSVEYIKIAVSTYREAIEAYYSGNLTYELKEKLFEKLSHVYNRQSSPGFYFGVPEEWHTEDYEKGYEKIYIGDVMNYYAKVGVAEVNIYDHQIEVGDEILIYGKTTPATFFTAKKMQQYHKDVKIVKKGEPVGLKVPIKVRRNDKVFLWKPVV